MTVHRREVITALAALPLVGACNRTSVAKAEVDKSAKRSLANLYDCEGCEGVFERDAAVMKWEADVASPNEPGEVFVFEGVVYQADGKTPAPNVVLYAYHTNADGLYANGTNETEWSRRHGRLRGWIKTGADGRYRFRSVKPAPYPNDELLAHVHLTVQEPDRRPYWIDDIVFDGEFGVTAKYRRLRTNKGGNGIVRLARSADGVWQARRDIFLETHP